MNGEVLTVYTQSGALLAELHNATDIGYNLVHNDLWTASFSLPSSDPNNKHCEAHNLVHIPDYGRDLGLYRIIATPGEQITEQGGMTMYQLEHVMATLLDDPLFGYHEIGGPEITTDQVINYILSFQETPRWVLGTCDFSDQFVYKFENVGLLSALLSLGEVIVDDYTWVFDTSVTPWEVSLKRGDSAPGCGILYKRNMGPIEKAMDATTLVTKLFLLGYGEGVNQLTVRDVNNGKPYILADTIDKWGVKGNVFVDSRLEDAETLLARGRAIMEILKNPYISYTASVFDLSVLTGQSWDRHMPGKLVRVQDDEHGLNFDARIVSVAKNDARGRPGEVDITIANAPKDTADSINTLADRVGIGELYSQGATNLYSQQYSDNADPGHPARFRIYVPGSCVRINAMRLIWELEAFRAYETGASAGGGSAQTSGAGGGGTVTSGASSLSTSDVPLPSNITSKADYGITGSTTPSMSMGSPSAANTGGASTYSGITDSASGSGSHSHGFSFGHTHTMAHTHSISGGSHTHTLLDTHTHVFNHQHNMPHTHSVSTSAHTHSVSIPAHTHDILYGIYEGTTASSVTLRVDGMNVPIGIIEGDELDVSGYLATDDDGKITRGTWHLIELIPDRLTRIEANLFVQTFIQSRGGGDW